jgi:3-oxoacyl-[acyl-carrier-protein] synthase III
LATIVSGEGLWTSDSRRSAPSWVSPYRWTRSSPSIRQTSSGSGGTSIASFTVATQALTESGTRPSDLDLIVLGLTDLPEYLYWDAAASLQHRLGADNAEALLITQACTAGIAALDVVAGKFATRPHYQNALVVAANRCCDTYWNRMDTQPMVFSDGAAAAVAQRAHPRLRWRCCEAVTNGRYADFNRMDVGGAARPFTASTAGEQPRARDTWDIMEFFDYDDEKFEGFVHELNSKAALVVQRACERIGVGVKDIRHAVLLHDNARSVRSLAEELGLPVPLTNLDVGLDTGHLGAADHLFSLGHAVRGGGLAPGDLVALVGMGRGMHWACALLEM